MASGSAVKDLQSLRGERRQRLQLADGLGQRHDGAPDEGERRLRI